MVLMASLNGIIKIFDMEFGGEGANNQSTGPQRTQI